MRYRLPSIRQIIPAIATNKVLTVGMVFALGASMFTLQVLAQNQAVNNCPNEEPITVPNTSKKLIRLGSTRIGKCIKPDLIFIHATNGGTLDSNWEYFDSGSGGQETNAHFIVGVDGKIYQTVEFYQSVTEYARTNDPYNFRSIGIELVHDSMHFENKADVPSAQYNATLQLVSFLMKQYNIPLGQHDASWVSNTNFQVNPDFTSGVYGHYQIGPRAHQDPGQEMFAAFRNDLKSAGAGTTTPPVGGGGGRIVPYDAYARPYSWPTTGKIKQPYGFTEEAQSLGQRFPGMYPLGDPGVIFSKTNHTEPPLDPAKAKYLNPNIDIEPAGDVASARAVYSTQAGWITFAGWAGAEKGYSIQIESDVEGDGQADLATRYMRLQAPIDGFFAPDIAEYYPEVSPASNPTEQNPRNLDAKAPPVYTVEAEHMKPDNTELAKPQTDAAASGGMSMYFGGNTAIRQSVERKADQLMISAKASSCPAIGAAEMAVLINNVVVERIKVTSNIWQTYSVKVDNLNGSKHTLAIALTNHLNMGLCKRELWIDTVNYVITNPNTPTITTASTTTIEAENLSDATEGNKKTKIITDKETSNEKYVAFTSNSKIEGNIELADPNYFSIRARADLCGDEVPKLKVSLDGKELLLLGVNQTQWMDYSTDLSAGAASTAPSSGSTPGTNPAPTPPSSGNPTDTTSTTRKLTIEFINDEFKPLQCDRNAYVDVLTFKKYEITQTTYSKTSLIGKTKYVAFNQLIGYLSSSRGTDEEWSKAAESIKIDLNTTGNELEKLKEAFAAGVPNANQTYLSYRIMYNNPNMTTFPPPSETDLFINARVDNPYIVESDTNKIAGNLRTVFDEPQSPMYFFCALRQRGENVKCIYEPNP